MSVSAAKLTAPTPSNALGLISLPTRLLNPSCAVARVLSKTPGVGLEPTTSRLTAERICQIELPRIGLPRKGVGDCTTLYVSGILPYEPDDSRLNRGVAVGAQEYTLARLECRLRDRPCHASVAEREALLGRHKMVELQSGNASVVPTSLARTPGAFHEQLLDPSTPAGDGL